MKPFNHSASVNLITNIPVGLLSLLPLCICICDGEAVQTLNLEKPKSEARGPFVLVAFCTWLKGMAFECLTKIPEFIVSVFSATTKETYWYEMMVYIQIGKPTINSINKNIGHQTFSPKNMNTMEIKNNTSTNLASAYHLRPVGNFSGVLRGIMRVKNFLFPQNMVRADEMNGFFGGLYRCGSAASGVSDWGVSKTVRAISILLHNLEKGKYTDPAASGSAASSYCNLGANENSRFRSGKENF